MSDDSPGRSVSEVASQCRRHGLGLGYQARRSRRTPAYKHALGTVEHRSGSTQVVAPRRLPAPGARSDWMESNMHNRTAGMTGTRISQRLMLDAIQQGEQFVYSLITREGAVKIGCSSNLMNRKKTIGFGGVRHFVGFRPGGFAEERAIHRTLGEHRIFGSREYYYPVVGLLPAINDMREWMGVEPLTRRDLPRLASCKFHRRVQELQAERGVLLGD